MISDRWYPMVVYGIINILYEYTFSATPCEGIPPPEDACGRRRGPSRFPSQF